MATAPVTETTTPTRYSQTGAAVTMTAADVANGNHIDSSRNVMVIANNTGASPYTVTITSVADNVTGRTGDVAAQSLAADEIRIFLLTASGWSDASDQYLVSASNAAVKFGWCEL